MPMASGVEGQKSHGVCRGRDAGAWLSSRATVDHLSLRRFRPKYSITSSAPILEALIAATMRISRQAIPKSLWAIYPTDKATTIAPTAASHCRIATSAGPDSMHFT